MTEKQRVVLNVLTTYGRTLLTIGCGLFAGRWTLMALGELDYGLYGVVGGLTGFISFINGIMAAAVGRFYAYAVGQAKRDDGEGIEICRKWFNTALVVHTVIPLLLIVVGYPIAEWVVRHWLVIPPDRIGACVTVLRCVCVTCFVGMINVPFSAMYSAKQYIAELTVYGIVQTLVNIVFLYYIVLHPGSWLTRYALWNCLLACIPMVIIAVRAVFVFPECHFRRQYLFDKTRFKELFAFAIYRFGGSFSIILGQQGMALLVNKMLGARKNAAMAVGSTISGHSQTFAGALSGAMYPVITIACGEGKIDKMRKWAYASCRFATVLVLIFALPLFLEVEEVMVLWLKNPPAGAATLCVCLICGRILEDLTCGHYMTIFSFGDIRNYQIACAVNGLLIIPIAYLGIKIGLGILGIGFGYVISAIVCVFIRLYYGRKVGTMSIRFWIQGIFFPLLLCSILAVVPGILVTCFMSPSFIRVVLTTLSIEIVLLPLVWFFIFDLEEKELVRNKITSWRSKFKIQAHS